MNSLRKGDIYYRRDELYDVDALSDSLKSLT